MHRNLFHSRSILVAGSAVMDVYCHADAVWTDQSCVRFRCGSMEHHIAYEGPPLRWGDKRVARDMNGQLRKLPAKMSPGGGSFNTAEGISVLSSTRETPCYVTLVDLAACTEELETAWWDRGISLLSLGKEAMRENLILTHRGGDGNRIILKTPVRTPMLSEEDARNLWQRLNYLTGRTAAGSTVYVVINSPKSVQLAQLVSDAGRNVQALQFSVLTGSLPPDAERQILLGRDEASICNLEEFAGLTRTVGIDCPDDERSAEINEIASALAVFGERVSSGHLVVTLGRRGCLVMHGQTRAMRHIHLDPQYEEMVHAAIRANPAVVNGAGDFFAAAFVVAYSQRGADCGPFTAAQAASLDAIRRLVPQFASDPSWIVSSPGLRRTRVPCCEGRSSGAFFDREAKRA